MAQFPALPLWTDAYLADTGHLTTIEHGAYMLLLMTMWRAGGKLPNDDKQLARYCRLTAGQWARVKPTLLAFFKVNSDSITQGRLTDELAIVRQKSAKQSNSARAKWRKENNKRHASADAETPIGDIPDGCQVDAPISTPTIEEDKSSSLMSETSSDEHPEEPKNGKGNRIYSEDFEAFWQSYPRSPNMSKPKAMAGWKKLSSQERLACSGAVGAYKTFLAGKPDHPTMHAATFINERRFEGFAEKATPKLAVDEDAWAKRLKYGRTQQRWSSSDWGPAPGQEDCRVPAHLIQPTDGANWREMEKSA